MIALYHLKIGMACSPRHSLFEKCCTDLSCKPLPPKVFLYVDSIDSNIISVKDPQSCGNDLSVLRYGSADSPFGNCPVHRRNYFAVNGVCHSFQIKKSRNPLVRNLV